MYFFTSVCNKQISIFFYMFLLHLLRVLFKNNQRNYIIAFKYSKILFLCMRMHIQFIFNQVIKVSIQNYGLLIKFY